MLNAYTASQRASPAVSARGLRRSPRWADGPAVPSPPPFTPASRRALVPCAFAEQQGGIPSIPVRQSGSQYRASLHQTKAHAWWHLWSPLVWEFPNTCVKRQSPAQRIAAKRIALRQSHNTRGWETKLTCLCQCCMCSTRVPRVHWSRAAPHALDSATSLGVT